VTKQSSSRSLALSLLSVLSASAASSQTIDQSITFGDSTVDSGFYKALPNPGGNATYNAYWPTAVAAGAGKPTTSPGPVYSQALAAHFGLTASPANQLGGTNFATSGAKDVTVNDAQTGGFLQAIPTTTQIADYLAAVHHDANPHALYLISSGSNDVSYALGNSGIGPYPLDPSAYLKSAANSLASSVDRLHAAGARYIVVPDLPFSFPTGNSAADATERSARLLYSKALWGDLGADGINFIPADINAVRLAILAKPSAFGFQFIDTNPADLACTRPAGVTSAWALLCSSNPAAPSTLVAPNAERTRLFADDQHLTTAGQKIVADYIYSLIIAPSEISLLPESAIKDRLRSLLDIRNQIEASGQQRGPDHINAWVTGDVANLDFDNADAGFPGGSGDPKAITAGVDYKWSNGLLTGAVVGVENQTSEFDAGGNFTQHEVAGSLYAAYGQGPLWGDVIGTYGGLNFDVNRMVPVGITIQPNAGKTDGNNPSASIEGGYRFGGYSLTQGPVVASPGSGPVWAPLPRAAVSPAFLLRIKPATRRSVSWVIA
jgi:outer membrane lipase/esterase